MSLITRILSRLFERTPKYEVSAYRTIYTAVVGRLSRTGVTIGKTAKVPRVEVHSIREGERLDKDGALRQVTMTVESISNRSLGDATQMNEDNLKRLTEYELELDGWKCLGVVPVQLQDLTETSDTNKILYRLLQEVTIFLEKEKEDEEIEIAVPEDPIPVDPEDPVDPEYPVDPEDPIPADPEDPEPGDGPIEEEPAVPGEPVDGEQEENN